MVGIFDKPIFCPQSNLHFLVVEKCLEENRVDSSIQQTRDLFCENRRAIDSARLRVIRSNAQWADAPGHGNGFAMSRLQSQPSRARVDLPRLFAKAEPVESDSVRSKSVGFNHLRADRDVGIMHLAHSFRIAQAKFFQTTLQWNAVLEQHCPHGAVATDQSTSEFLEKIHSAKRLASPDTRVNLYAAFSEMNAEKQVNNSQ